MNPLRILLPVILTSFISCSHYDDTPAAIRDFRQPLQTYLTGIVARGIVGWDSSTKYIEQNATDEELRRLSNCEHPVLRSVALRAMLDRPSFDHFAVIMNNLDDTAVVAINWGEWGIKYYTVSDDLLQNGRWKDTAARNRTYEVIITRHNRLDAAYYVVWRAKLKPGWYQIIRQMAFREQEDNGEEVPLRLDGISFETREKALYALASYQKKEDIPLIRELLLAHAWQISLSSFALMSAFPDTSYMSVYEKSLHSFYRKLTRDGIPEEFSQFINSLAAQKNQRSAALMEGMLARRPFMPCSVDTNYMRHELYFAIWDNSCLAYRHLRPVVEAYCKMREAQIFDMPPIEPLHFNDTSKEPLRWW